MILKYLVTLDIDYPRRKITGTAVNTLAPLRKGRADAKRLKSARTPDASAVWMGSSHLHQRKATIIDAPSLIPQGKDVKVSVRYSAAVSRRGLWPGDGGFHWINPPKREPERSGILGHRAKPE